MKPVYKVLKETREFLKTHDWCKGYFAHTKTGKQTSSSSQHAASWCALGSFYKLYPKGVVGGYRDKAISIIEGRILDPKWESLPAYNDDPKTTKEDIINLFTKAMRIAR